ncbi:aldo/keto reductase [Parasalinivibrio latis]|uniref:aldo/keto reductase n=1 Tax=Parasalinivibrio latis TaxID=2952610 RepID=UPI0030E3781D
MLYREIGNTGIEASVVVLGTWGIGGGSVWGGDTEEKQLIDTIHAAIDGGVNFIDTAPGYGFGESERVIGKAIKGRRDDLVIATKCGLIWDWDGVEHFATDGKTLKRNLTPQSIRREVEESLARLGTDYLDLYQVHWPAIPPMNTPIEETLDCLVSLQQEGKLRALGISNLTEEETRQYCSGGHMATNQIRYSMLWEDEARPTIELNQELGMSTLAYQTLEQGLLSGKITMDTQFDPNDIRAVDAWNPWFVPEKRRQVLEVLAGWQSLTNKYNCSMAQLVIAASYMLPGVDFVLCGARTSHHAAQNAAAGELQVSPEDALAMLADIRALF